MSTLRAGQEKQLRAAGVELIPYRAVVTGPHTVEAGGAAYEAAHILVAAGSEPALPPIPGLDTPGVVTSDGLLSDLRPLGPSGHHRRRSDRGGAGVCLGRRRRPRHHPGGGPPPPAHPGAGAGPESGRAAQAGRGGGVHRSRRHRRRPRPCRRLHPPGGGATGWRPTLSWWPPGGGPPPAASLPGTSCRSWSGGSSGWTDSSAPPSPPSMPSGTPSAGPCWPTRRRRRERFVADLLLGRTPLRGVAPIPACVYTSPELAQVGLTAGRGQGPGHPRCRRQVCAGGQRPYPHRGGKAGLRQAGIPPGEPRPVGGSVVLLTGPPTCISELALAVTLELTAEQLLRPVRPHPTFAEAISEAVEAAFPLS